ncbi:MAG: hypothetical protein HQL94_07050 [Magnetococcales bacterium]|nr:hypothetical protein [Magnetococcales bacterium]
MLADYKIQLPTLEEDDAINHGISMDPDTMEISDMDFNKLKPFQFQPINIGKWTARKKHHTPSTSTGSVEWDDYMPLKISHSTKTSSKGHTDK